MAEREDRDGRIAALDVIRGVAVLGILPVNAAYFAGSWRHALNPTLPPLDVAGPDLWAWAIPHVFFEGKFIALFSMLFGVSVFLVGEGGGAVLRRRLFWLAAFGALHGALIWSGDVLLLYAVCGIVLYLLRGLPALTLGVSGAALVAASAAFSMLQGLALQSVQGGDLADLREAIWAPSAEELRALAAAYGGTLGSAARANFDSWLEFATLGVPLTAPRTIGLMMLGLALFKSGFFEARWPRPLYAACIALAAAALALIAAQALENARRGFPFLYMYAQGMSVNATLAPVVSLGYAAGLVLLAQRAALSALRAVGRMAFTNYIAQSLIMTTLLWGGRGFGLYGHIDRAGLMAIVAAVWIAQLIWSPLWLKAFAYGPLEAMWRRLSNAEAFSRATTR